MWSSIICILVVYSLHASLHIECIYINTPTWRNSFKRLLCTGCIVIFCQEKHLPFPPPACSYGWNFILRNFLSRISDHYNAGRDFCPVKIFSSMEYLCTCTLYWKYFSLAWLDRGPCGFHLSNSFVLGQWAVKLKLLEWVIKTSFVVWIHSHHSWFLVVTIVELLLKQATRTAHVMRSCDSIDRHPSLRSYHSYWIFCWHQQYSSKRYMLLLFLCGKYMYI